MPLHINVHIHTYIYTRANSPGVHNTHVCIYMYVYIHIMHTHTHTHITTQTAYEELLPRTLKTFARFPPACSSPPKFSFSPRKLSLLGDESADPLRDMPAFDQFPATFPSAWALVLVKESSCSRHDELDADSDGDDFLLFGPSCVCQHHEISLYMNIKGIHVCVPCTCGNVY